MDAAYIDLVPQLYSNEKQQVRLGSIFKFTF